MRACVAGRWLKVMVEEGLGPGGAAAGGWRLCRSCVCACVAACWLKVMVEEGLAQGELLQVGSRLCVCVCVCVQNGAVPGG